MEIQILNRKTSEVLPFTSVDAALRTLVGIDDDGDRLGKVLLDVPSRRTHKQSVEILDRNGYQIHRDPIMPKVEPAGPAVTKITADELDAVTGFKLMAELLHRFGFANIEQPPVLDQAAVEKIVDARLEDCLRKLLAAINQPAQE